MNRKFNRLVLIVAFLVVVAVCMSIGLAYLPQSRTGAQTGTPSAKSAVQVGNVAVMDGRLGATSTKTSWQTIMSTNIKTSSQKDLIMNAALEVGLYTRTLVRSKT